MISPETELQKRFEKVRGQLANARGLAAEHKVRYYLYLAGKKRVHLSSLSRQQIQTEVQLLGPFASIEKRSMHPTLEKRLEFDLFGQAESEQDPNILVEVKDWENRISASEIDAFLAKKEQVQPLLERPTLFMMYSERGFGQNQIEKLAKNGVLACDAELLPLCSSH